MWSVRRRWRLVEPIVLVFHVCQQSPSRIFPFMASTLAVVFYLTDDGLTGRETTHYVHRGNYVHGCKLHNILSLSLSLSLSRARARARSRSLSLFIRMLTYMSASCTNSKPAAFNSTEQNISCFISFVVYLCKTFVAWKEDFPWKCALSLVLFL